MYTARALQENKEKMTLKTVTATRYLTPLREGGSLPAIVEASDGELYVMKFVGAGHGRKALIAELLAGEIGRILGLNIPEMVFMELDPGMGPSEPDQEIHDLLKASTGLNLGFQYLSQALAFNPLAKPLPAPRVASDIVWFDAFITNVDRTARNTNILVWRKELWLIDHGSALYFHHDWRNYVERSTTPFPPIRDHVLLPFASELDEAQARFRPRLTPEVIGAIVGLIPEVWLDHEPQFATSAEHRQSYVTFLSNRLQASPAFVQEAKNARAEHI
jgi:hypothetical protein